MSGQCYSCGDAFGFFKKEHGCKNCGYSFCNGCLNQKANIPKLNNEKHKVCLKCYNIITKKVKPPEQILQAPDAYYKRMAALESGKSADKQQPSHGQLQQTSKQHSTKHKYLSKEDQAIAERLEKLKEARRKEAKPIPTHKEMEQRLAKLKADRPAPSSEEDMRHRLAVLKGQDPAATQTKHTFETDKRSEQEQIDDLMKQYFEEVQIDQKSNPSSQTDNMQNDLNLDTNDKGKTMADKNIPSDEKDLDEINQLMQQTAKEQENDATKAITGLSEDKDLMDKIKDLKKQRKKDEKKRNNKENDENNEEKSESENDDEMAQNVIKQILEDSRREEEEDLADLTGQITKLPNPPASDQVTAGAAGSGMNSGKYDNEEDDELPWCIICNNDAALRCLGCDGDLYCNRCFREGHPKYELEDHRTVPFRPK